MSLIRLATTDVALRRCYAVMRQLRPHLSEEQYLAQVRRQEEQGYCTAMLEEGSAGILPARPGGTGAAPVESAAPVRAVAGYRIMENLFSGVHMYVDDLVTDETTRSRGQGAELLDWLIAQAGAAGCVSFELDSGTQRIHAHRFYLRQRMVISAFHFRLPLT